MFYQILKFKLLLILCLLSQLTFAGSPTIADQIKKNFDDNLYKMRPIKQSHYAVRLYRITGNSDYLYPIISFQFIEAMQLKKLLKQRPQSIEKFNSKAIQLPPNYEELSKTNKRKLLLDTAPGIANALNQLIILDHAQQLNLLSSPLYPHARIALQHISDNKEALRSFLLDFTVIKASSAQVANYIHILNRLEIIDLRQEYIHHFRIVFSDEKDASLKDKMFEDKVYGLTHIIFASSAYYQSRISYQEFKWVYDYFEKNMDRILTKTKPDVIAEVGLAYCLLSKATHPALVDRIKAQLAKQFDSKTQMLAGKPGFDDLNRAEHRNVLTIMLFKCPFKLSPGPDLGASDSLLNTLQPIQPL